MDFAACFTSKQHPGVLAKGMLAMLRWTKPRPCRPSACRRSITRNHDKPTLPRASEDMRRLIPSAELLMVEQAGHPGFLERSPAYDQAIAGFAARCLEHVVP